MEPTQLPVPAEADAARTTMARPDLDVAVAVEPVADPRAAFRALPEPIRLEDTVPLQETVPAQDPAMGRDTEKEFMLRYI